MPPSQARSMISSWERIEYASAPRAPARNRNTHAEARRSTAISVEQQETCHPCYDRVCLEVWMRIGGLLLAVGFVGVAWAEQGERAPAQKPGLPPPYYASRYGPSTTSHRFLAIEDAIAAALEQASDYRQARVGERVAD